MKQLSDLPQLNNTFFSKEKHLLFVLLCSFGLLFASCGDNSTGPGNGNGNGNGNGEPLEPTFTNVQPILTENCGPCHIGNNQSGVQLDSYSNVMNSNGGQYGGAIVVEGEADDSPLVDKIEEDPDKGERMPQGGPYLSSDQISLIRDWISEGAQDN